MSSNNMLNKNSKIYIAGHHGLVGSAIWNNLKKRGYNNMVGRSHKELDLTDQYAVEKFFDEERPDATSFEGLVRIMVENDMAKVAAEDAGMKVRTNLAEYLEKGIVK